MSLPRLAFVVCCLLMVAAPLPAADEPPDPALYASLRWRMIGPFRGR